MRYASIMLACWAALVATVNTSTTIAADKTFPYRAYVNSRDVYVRSGPGRDYYPTEKLQPSTPIEVYRHDPGGWYAIRPTEKSYSWVSSRYIKPAGDGLGEVTRDKVASRVGSVLSNVRDVIQIRLEKGELVEIRDEVNFGGQTWYKIAPPAGEFRWISGRFVDRKKPHDGVSQPRHRRATRNGRPNDSPRQIAQADDAALADPETSEYSDETDDPVATEDVLADAQPIDDDTANDAAADPTDEVQQAVYWAEAPVSEASDSEGRVEKPNRVAPDLKGALKEIDLRLSQMVAEEPTVWHFANMNDQLTELLDRATTALERGRVRQVLSKIATFEDIQARYQQMNQLQATTDRANQQLDATRTTRRHDNRVQRAVAWEDADHRFDGVGLLRPVVSRRADAPQYALVDRRGDVLTFITPAPGMNLRPLLGQRIGVTGTRGFMPEYNRPHVMVQRITALDTRQR